MVVRSHRVDWYKKVLGKSLAFISALSLLGVLFLTVFIDSKTKYSESPQLIVREIDVQLPPPPPPLPEVQQVDQSNTTDSINLFGGTSPARMSFSESPKISFKQVSELEQPKFEFGEDIWKKTLAVDFPEVEVKDLDAIPSLISSINVRVPRELRKQGVSSVEVRVQVLIVENGRAYIRKIIDMGYPEMEDVIRKYIKHVKFTVPTKHGRPVHAIYYWTIRFVEVL